MKVVYLDTNLYIALLKHNDINFPLMQKIITQPHLSFVTSPITVVELSSVISREFENLNIDRLFDELKIEKDDPTASEEIILFLIDYLISQTNTEIISDPQIEQINYFKHEYMMNPIYKIAILDSSKIRIRTLDLIHYAYASYFNTIQRTRVDYLLSGDLTFISHGRLYKGTRDFTFIDPETIVKLECH